MNYISISDITHGHLRRFNTADLQAYVDKANAKYEQFAGNLGIYGADIQTPISEMCKSFILAMLYMDIASDNIGSEGSHNISDNNLYTSIYGVAFENYKELKPQITENAIKGAMVDRASSAVNFGKIVRS